MKNIIYAIGAGVGVVLGRLYPQQTAIALLGATIIIGVIAVLLPVPSKK